MTARPSGRTNASPRTLHFEPDYLPHAEGSCLVKAGNTWVLCTASIEERTPMFLKGKGEGWLTAEYGMLPRATGSRNDREAAKGKQSGRTQEIQRLIGRSLRSVLDLRGLGERQIIIDCDVLRADGGTRTAAITGGFIALYQACVKGAKKGTLPSMPVKRHAAAISCAIYNGSVVVDPDYIEDSNADADANFVISERGEFLEIQATAEKNPFTEAHMSEMKNLAGAACKNIIEQQQAIIRGFL